MKDKHLYFVLALVVVVGLTLRVLAAFSIPVAADDMHFAPHAIDIINSGALETYDQSAPLWFYITDVFYKLFGISQFTSRLSGILFGTLSIILIYLFSSYVFQSKKIGLVSSFLLAVCPFAFTSMRAEMDAIVVFFLLANLYLLYRGVNENSKLLIHLSFIFLGIAILIKIYAVLFIFISFIYLFYTKIKDKTLFSKKSVLLYTSLSLILFIFLLPTLTHNYLLYQEKGIVDLQFTRVFGIGKEKSAEFYSWDVQFEKSFSLRELFSKNTGLYPALKSIFKVTPLIFTLGLVGFIPLFKRKRNLFYLLLFAMITTLVYLSAIILLTKHFLIIASLLILPASYLISKLILKNKKRIYIFVAVILIFSLFYSGQYLFYKEPVSHLMSYKSDNIEEASLVIVDSRIYTGQTAWIFNDRNYIDVNIFIRNYQNIKTQMYQ